MLSAVEDQAFVLAPADRDGLLFDRVRAGVGAFLGDVMLGVAWRSLQRVTAGAFAVARGVFQVERRVGACAGGGRLLIAVVGILGGDRPSEFHFDALDLVIARGIRDLTVVRADQGRCGGVGTRLHRAFVRGHFDLVSLRGGAGKLNLAVIVKHGSSPGYGHLLLCLGIAFGVGQHKQAQHQQRSQYDQG